jgi:hypothetical protein
LTLAFASLFFYPNCNSLRVRDLAAFIKRLVIRGKAFIEPDVAPILARHEVAEPLMLVAEDLPSQRGRILKERAKQERASAAVFSWRNSDALSLSRAHQTTEARNRFGRLSSRPSLVHRTGKSGKPAGWKACPAFRFMESAHDFDAVHRGGSTRRRAGGARQLAGFLLDGNGGKYWVFYLHNQGEVIRDP